MPDLNIGRHYHSSCGFGEKSVYVFCGIANKTRKYINSIEKYDQANRNSWQLIEVSQKLFADRQGAGVAQRDGKDILIFGGFSGKFLRDSFLLDVNTNQITRTAQCPNEVFLFQMPTVFDGATNSIFTCDLQKQLVYKFDERGNWSTH
jgi:N-acetylneuraminic acid mutarotase